MISLIAEYLECCPALNLHGKGCNVNSSMMAPQWHLCRQRMRTPSRYKKAMLRISPPSTVPIAANGIALCNGHDQCMLTALKHVMRCKCNIDFNSPNRTRCRTLSHDSSNFGLGFVQIKLIIRNTIPRGFSRNLLTQS